MNNFCSQKSLFLFQTFVLHYSPQNIYTLYKLDQMQKYRKWTDESTGVNPFINSKTSHFSVKSLIISAILTVVKLNLISFFLFPIVTSLFLQKFLFAHPLLQKIINLPLMGLAYLFGLWDCDDSTFMKWLSKRKKRGQIILSNSLSVLDAFYYMAKIPSARFLVSSSQEQNFQVIFGLQVIKRLLFERQPFFNTKSSVASENFKTTVQNLTSVGHTCIIFYEGIRTNGLGTIKISKKLSTELFNLQKNYCITHLKYTSAPEGLFSLVTAPAVLLLIGLGSFKTSLKIRSSPVDIQTQHSPEDIQKDFDNFLMANGAKLLDTDPTSYFQFLQFYNKSQNTGYTQISQQSGRDDD